MFFFTRHIGVTRIESMIRKWGYIILLVSIASAAPSDEGKQPLSPGSTSQDSPSPSSSFFGNLRRSISPRSFTRLLSSSMGLSGETVLLESDAPRSQYTSLHQRYLHRSLTMALSSGEPISPTLKLDTIQLAEYDGYDAERHSVITEDGYILEVHRINNRTARQDDSTAKPVVILQHGFLIDSRAFLILRQGKSLGYWLADAGYDVWLNNVRGNTYSRKHKTLTPDMKEFWDFSYTEYGAYDLPAVINYALKVTRQSKAHYIGHSMGTQLFFIMASKRPKMLSKVKSYTALAPLSTTTDGRSGLLQMLMKNYQAIAAGFDQIGVSEFLSKNQKLAGIPLTNDSWYSKIAGSAVLFALSGENPLFDQSILLDLLAHLPAGSSVKTLRHYGQNYMNGFREYDYGAEGNLARYNSEEPPLFDFSNMNVPSQIYFGNNDMVADFKNAINICRVIPKVFRCEAVDDTNFGHGDFLWSTNAPSLLYGRLIDGLRHFDQQQ